MKKLFLMIMAAAALWGITACEQTPQEEPVPALVDVAFNSLAKGNTTTGNVNILPVSATNADGDVLELSFYTDKIYLSAGTYSFGKNAGNYEGHFKNKKLDLDITSGSITVAVEGEEDYTISGTVRLDNEQGTAVKFVAKGKLVYEFPTEYYYTCTPNKKIGEKTATLYQIFDMTTSYQLAEVAVVGTEGAFEVKDSGAEGTAIIGYAHGGTWFMVNDYGSYAMLHGKVTVGKSHGKMNFVFEDIKSATFNNCELKSSFTPQLRKGDNPIDHTKLTGRMFSVKSPIKEGFYELTAKLYYSDGSELISATVFAMSENPCLEDVGKRKNFMPVNSLEKVVETPPSGGHGYMLFDAGYYFIDGVAYDVGESIAVQLIYKNKNDVESLGVIPLLSATAMPEPLFTFLCGGAEPTLQTAMYTIVGSYLH